MVTFKIAHTDNAFDAGMMMRDWGDYFLDSTSQAPILYDLSHPFVMMPIYEIAGSSVSHRSRHLQTCRSESCIDPSPAVLCDKRRVQCP